MTRSWPLRSHDEARHVNASGVLSKAEKAVLTVEAKTA